MKNSLSKKITSLFLTVIMVLSLFTTMIVPTFAVEAHTHSDDDDVKTVASVPGCFEVNPTDIMTIKTIAKREMSVGTGGNNVNNGEIDGNLNTGVATTWVANANAVNIVYYYDDSYLITNMSVWFTAGALNAGYDIYFSNDGGKTWGNPVISYKATNQNEVYDGDRIDQAPTASHDYEINNGDGIVANSIKFDYTGTVKTYHVDLWEIDAVAYKVVPCTWDKGAISGQPNCNTNMEITYTCTKCGKEDIQKIEDTKSNVHSWIPYSSSTEDTTKDATDTENGYKTLFCPLCGTKKKVDVPATGHEWEVQSVVPATCGEEGYTVYKATDAEITYIDDYKEALGHIWHGGEVTKIATTKETGIKTYHCLRDDCNEIKEVTIPLATLADKTFRIGNANVTNLENGSSRDNAKQDAIFDGVTSGSYWCARTGETITIELDEEYILVDGLLYIAGNYASAKIEFLNASGDVVLTHDTGAVNDGEMIITQDLYEKLKAGIYTKKIVITITGEKWDGDMPRIYELALDAHVCQYDDSTITDRVPANCKEGTEGSYKNKCYLCEREKTFVIPVSEGHVYTDVVTDTAPTCGKAGVGHATCTECDELVEGIVIPATGEHEMELVAEFDPSCGEYGYGRYTCKECSYSSENVLIDPTEDHLWDNGTVANGKKTSTCQLCGATKEEDAIDISAHNFESEKVDATCTTVGYTEYTCTDPDCDVSYREDYVAALGHDFDDGEIIKHASVYSDGLKVYTCQRDCGITKMEVLEKVTMGTHSKKITKSSIVSAKVYDSDGEEIESLLWGTADPSYMFDGANWANYYDQAGAWYTGAGNYVDIVFDNAYYITAANLYYASNWNTLKIEFFDADGNVVGTYNNAALDGNINSTKDDIMPIELTQCLGVWVKSIRVTSVTSKTVSKFGDGLKIYELDLIAHEHQFDADAEVTEGDCYEKGSVIGTCYECEISGTFYTDYVHEYGDLEVEQEPTCVDKGVGYYECQICGERIENIEIAATGDHKFSKEVIDTKSDCQTKGSHHMECSVCGTADPDSYEEDENFGPHNYIWVTTRPATFTRKGEETSRCSICGADEGIPTRETNNKDVLTDRFITLDGYSIRYTDFEGVRATFTLNRSEYNKIKDYGHTMTITAKVTVNGVTKTVVIENINSSDNTFSVVIKGLGYEDKVEKIELSVTLSDEYGTVTKDFTKIKSLQNDGTSMFDVADENKNNRKLSDEMKRYYQSIVDYINNK